jgi:16S rRNA (cytosine1402-N4)-methyltransferase
MSLEQSAEGQGHEPVLQEEVIGWLRPQTGGLFVDCTLGLGGHSEAILQASPDALVIGLDRDRQALSLAKSRLARFENRFRAVHADFKDLAAVLTEQHVTAVQGLLADLGVSSMQLEDGARGFSFSSDAPLDMRMDQSEGETAADLVKRLSERELADLIFEFGEERGARRIARAIARARASQPLTTTRQLADIIVRALRVPGRWRIHPATRTFQAIRIAVNDELRSIDRFIPQAISVLSSSGRLAIISFHSLEDRIVKRSFQRESGRCLCQSEFRAQTIAVSESGGTDTICNQCGARKRVEVLTRKPARPTPREVERNPRSRSARLRVCEKL